VYLQTDPGTYVVGNIMHNLAGRDGRNLPLSPTPVAGSVIDLSYFSRLNQDYADFYKSVLEAKQKGDRARCFFVPPNAGEPDFSPSITSFLCTDTARATFDAGKTEFESLQLAFPAERYPGVATSMTNEECLAEARSFFSYASLEGYRGSPHKL
jgi:hypothetical protein